MQQIVDEIQSVDGGPNSAVPVVSQAIPPQKASKAAEPARRPGPKTLSALLLDLMAKAKGPRTIKELTEELHRRKFPSKSKKLSRVVETRVQELVAMGFIRRLKDHGGVVLAEAPSQAKASSAKGKASSAKEKPRKKGTPMTKATPRVATQVPQTNGKKKRSLRPLLLDLLAQSKEPIAAKDLAQKALDAGYRTKSKNLNDVIWSTLGPLDNVENIPGKGYRLKKR